MLFRLCLHEKRSDFQHTILRQIGWTNHAPFLQVSSHFSEESHTWDRTLYFSAPYLYVA